MHESTEHGFRLTVQDGSLHSPIGPISVQRFAQVVESENGDQSYLARMLVDCQPCGAEFPDRPLWMDFMVKGISPTKASETFQVCLCECYLGEPWANRNAQGLLRFCKNRHFLHPVYPCETGATVEVVSIGCEAPYPRTE